MSLLPFPRPVVFLKFAFLCRGEGGTGMSSLRLAGPGGSPCRPERSTGPSHGGRLIAGLACRCGVGWRWQLRLGTGSRGGSGREPWYFLPTLDWGAELREAHRSPASLGVSRRGAGPAKKELHRERGTRSFLSGVWLPSYLWRQQGLPALYWPPTDDVPSLEALPIARDPTRGHAILIC